jgi:uncharacterized membrane protein YfcA
MIWSEQTFILANSIIIFASVLQMVTGVSVGMIIVPFLAMISFTLVPVPIIFASLALTILMAYKGKKHIDAKNVFQINLGMLFGILIAIVILKNIAIQYLGVVFGVFILIAVIISLTIKQVKLSKTLNYTGGIIAGLMGTIAAVGGQILALLFQNHTLESIKSTLAFLYTIFSITMLLIFYIFDDFSYSQMISGFYMMPGFIIGYYIAPYFTKYFNEKYTKTMVLTMATLGALILIIQSIY